MTTDKKEERLEVSSIQQLLEKCKDGGRAIIYGEAGSGKTTALQNIALWWLDRQMAVPQAYDFVFLIPLRLVQSHSIIDIICLDCQLLPKEFRDNLSMTLAMKSKQILFLLDSYEELTVPRTEELTKLISRDLNAQATVFITSRPESQVTQIKPTPCIRAKLQNLSEGDIREYIACYLEGDQEIFSDLKENFGMDFLARPINLALACYMYTSLGTKGLHHVSQTQLFSQIVLQLLIVYVKKGSHVDIPLGNILDLFSTGDSRLTGAKVFFKEICRLCHETCQKGTKWLSTVDTDITVNDFINFGLFFPGPEPNTIDLPHRLFQEFLAALYLVRNQPAWEALFKDIERKCQDSDSTSKTSRYLGDVLGRMGLENVVRFIVGLSATHGHGQKLCSLFAIEQRRRTLDNHIMQSVYSYELQLLSECTADCVKSAMAEALVNAPVITVSGDRDHVNNSGAEQFVDMLTPQQSRQFLAKAYGCEVKENLSGQVTMSRANGVPPFVCDSFVVRCLQKFRCTALEMGEEMYLEHSRLPVDLLPLLTSGVSRYLYIRDCKLLPGGDVGRRDVADQTEAVAPKVEVTLSNVSGRRHLGDCHWPAPNVGQLELWNCGDVDICGLSQTFTQLWRLKVYRGNRLVYSDDWRPLHGMKELALWNCDGEAKLCVLRQLCPQLTQLEIDGCQVSWPDVRSQWLSLRTLGLWDLDEVKLCQVAQLSPCLEELRINEEQRFRPACAVCVDDVAGQLQSLQTLRLRFSHLVQRGRRLTEEEARQTLTHIWPSATIHIYYYQVTQCTEFTLDTSSCL